MKVPCLRGFVVCCANSYWLLAIDTYVRYDTVCTATGGVPCVRVHTLSYGTSQSLAGPFIFVTSG